MKRGFTNHLSISTAIHALIEEAGLWVIDEILMLLKDGNWHDLGEIVKKCSLNELKAEMIVSFLSKYDFMELNKKGRKARLRPLMLEFINEIQRIKEEENFKP